MNTKMRQPGPVPVSQPEPIDRFAEGAGQLGFAIIGVQKASTTSIQDYLHAHPAVCLPMGEIPCFESPDYEQGRASVQLSFAAETHGKLPGMKRPNIFPDPLAVQRLMRHSPGCKLIVVLRDPVDRFVSAYFHLMNSGKIPVREINLAVAQMFCGDYLSRHPAAMTLLHYGLYADRLEDIERSWGEGVLFVTSQQRLREDQRAILQELCAFLDLEFLEPASARVWRNRGSYDYRRARLLAPSNAVKYRFSAARLRKETRTNPLARLIGGGLSRLARKLPGAPLPGGDLLNAESRAWLSAYYAADRARLQESHGDLVYW